MRIFNFQFSIFRQQFRRGFTFIELILYMAIVSIIVGSLVIFAWNIIGGGVKSSVEQEVYANARYVSERIKYEIRRASGITSVAPSSISLTNFSPDTSTAIDLSSGKVRISQNGGTPVSLNSADTTVSSLVFTDYRSADNKTKHIQFTLTLTSNFAQARQEYQGSVSLESSAELRSN